MSCNARSSPRPSVARVISHALACPAVGTCSATNRTSSIRLCHVTAQPVTSVCGTSASPGPAGSSRIPPDAPAPAASDGAASASAAAPGAQPQRTPPSGPPPGEQPQYPPSFYEVMEMVSQGITPPNVRVGACRRRGLADLRCVRGTGMRQRASLYRS